MPVLRPYQAEVVASVIDHFRRSDAPACAVLPTGAGKSLVIAELARVARGRVLVLAHVKELCAQNLEKFRAYGHSAGIFSAGLGAKEASERVTFGSVQSVARHLDEFTEPVSLLIIDECHRVAEPADSQYRKVILSLQRTNPRLRVLGLTATPYRLDSGFIYRTHQRGFVRGEEEKAFEHCVYEVSLNRMIDDGYLTRPKVEDAPLVGYEFGALLAGRRGPIPEAELNALLRAKTRVTEAITREVISRAERENRSGVMFFAATVEHAREIARYLPSGEVALILGETAALERDAQIEAFKARRLRYLVNVSVLTTGFDAPHVDFIALLRPTESVSLFQQIVGRGLRLAPGKDDCLVIDYAGNGFSLFSPEVGEPRPSSDSVPVSVACPACGFANCFWGKVDRDGDVVEHYGRRCQNLLLEPSGKMERCEYRFRFKECEACGAENDIAARTCGSCSTVLVDPDTKLRDALRLKDAVVLRVSGMTVEAKNEVVVLTYHDEDGMTQSERFDFEKAGPKAAFNRIFGRRLAHGTRPVRFGTSEEVFHARALLPCPDFIVARKEKRFFRVVLRLFDYQGRFRRAEELTGR